MNVSTPSELHKTDTASVRCYHGINHIADLFHELKIAGDSIRVENVKALHNAIWMHDVDRTSAVRSAVVAYEAALKDSSDKAFAEVVMRLVLVTQHDPKLYPPTTDDEKLMCDLDLSSLALAWEDFAVNTAKVRKEYPHVSDEAFNSGRKACFRLFLSRPSIYYTDYFRNLYEAKAAANLQQIVRTASVLR